MGKDCFAVVLSTIDTVVSSVDVGASKSVVVVVIASVTSIILSVVVALAVGIIVDFVSFVSPKHPQRSNINTVSRQNNRFIQSPHFRFYHTNNCIAILFSL